MSDEAGAGGTGATEPVRDDSSRARLAGILALLVIGIVAIVLLPWPRPATVPDVTGMAETAARGTITGAGFTVGAVATRTVETSANGTVLEQDPAAGTSAEKGSAIALTVSVIGAGGSAGATGRPPAGTSLTPPGQALVPDVVGRPERDAVAAMSSAGFKTASTFASGNQPSGEVVNQFPSGGVMAPRGSVVQLTISTGVASSGSAAVDGPGGRTVPDALGMTLSGGRRRLSNAGFSVSVVNAPSTTTPRGLVFYQSPKPGPSGGSPSRVTIWISTGPPTRGRPYPLPPEAN